MGKKLVSVGLDVGTTSTQMVVSHLTVENRASSFAVPQMEISNREILYQSPVHFTPLVGENLVDGQKIRQLVGEEYRLAGITPTQVDTGAVIITGETSRKENARTVLESLSDFAGDFVVTTAGPHLESVLAAKGAGAVELSHQVNMPVLHMDIGGGTSNLSLIQDGIILRTGCLNVGGRLLKRDANGTVTYLSPVLASQTELQVGSRPSEESLGKLTETLCRVLCQAAGRENVTELLEGFSTKEAGQVWQPPNEPVLVSFSGGVADCIEKAVDSNAYGDIGPLLGNAIRKSSLCTGDYRVANQAIRATVIGAGSHSTQLSGSTVYTQNVQLPLKNLPVLVVTQQEQDGGDFGACIRQKLELAEQMPVVLALPGYESPTYAQVKALASLLAENCPPPIYLCLQQDMAKALGHALQLCLPKDTPCLCLDHIAPSPESFLDVGRPVGPCIPVVVKTLVLQERGNL